MSASSLEQGSEIADTALSMSASSLEQGSEIADTALSNVH